MGGATVLIAVFVFSRTAIGKDKFRSMGMGAVLGGLLSSPLWCLAFSNNEFKQHQTNRAIVAGVNLLGLNAFIYGLYLFGRAMQ